MLQEFNVHAVIVEVVIRKIPLLKGIVVHKALDKYLALSAADLGMKSDRKERSDGDVRRGGFLTQPERTLATLRLHGGSSIPKVGPS